jgi:hypothetical protein
MAGFGEIDYRQLDRMKGGISAFNEGWLRNEQTKVQLQQDQADREIAMKGTAQFHKAIESALPKEGKSPNYDMMFKAAAEAGETFAQGGGRHTQAAAQRIHQYLDDLVKIHPPQAIAIKPEYRDVLGPDGSPEVRTVNGIKFKHRQMFHPETGATMGEDWQKVQGEFAPKAPAKPRATAGGAAERGPKTQIAIEQFQDDPSNLRMGGKMTTKHYSGLATQVTEQIQRDQLVHEEQLKAYEQKYGLDLNKYADASRTPTMGDAEIQKIPDMKEKRRAIALIQSWQRIKAQRETLEKEGYGVGERFKGNVPVAAGTPTPAAQDTSVTHEYVIGQGLRPVGK